MDALNISQKGSSVIISVKVVPGSSKTSIEGLFDGALKIKLSTAPQKGKANKALIDFTAQKTGFKKNAFKIISGARSPLKQVEITGATIEQLLDKLT